MTLLEPKTRTPPCNCCGASMEKGENGGVPFLRCTKCGQRVSVTPYVEAGHTRPGIQMTILPRLYPSSMEEGSELYQEFLDYRIAEVTFDREVYVCFGLMEQKEADADIAKIKDLVACKRAELTVSKRAHPTAAPPAWWRFWA